MECLICGETDFKPYYYPPTIFNKKTFNYYECCHCHSAQISPLPDGEEMKLMYGSEDHSYLLALKENEKLRFTINYPRYNHQGYQLDFFKKYKYDQFGSTLLDVGCGSGFYMNHARSCGFTCLGIEFDAEFAKLLRSKTDLNIYSFEEFENLFKDGKKFDVIHLGHVLEHSVAPAHFLNSIKKFAHPETVFVIDGPLEKNKCLSRFFIKWGSKLQGKKSNSYPPQHITFTNRFSQLHFFEKQGLEMINYEVTEQMFPFPSKFQGETMKNKLLFILGRISVNLSKLIQGSGNIFHYAGQFK
jgi:SAM-dependent methyltransferase